jgi:hypothetical protein
MMFEPSFTGYGQVKAIPLVGGFNYEEGIVRVDLVFENFVYLGNGETGTDEPYGTEAMNAAAERLYRLVDLLIVLIKMELIRDEIYGHRDTPFSKIK